MSVPENLNAIRSRKNAQAGYAAPQLIGCKRPDAHQREQQHHFLKQRVERAIDKEDARNRIAEAGIARFARGGGASVGAPSGNSTIAARPNGYQAANTAAQSKRDQPARWTLDRLRAGLRPR